MHYPIIPWIGGKRRLAKEILPLFPEHTCYVEAFAGGAALFFMKAPSKVEVLNDANGELVNLYRVVTHHLEEFVRQFKWALTSRQLFEWLQMTPTAPLTDIQRAARFYYLQKMCFGGKIESQTFGTATTTPPRLNLLRIEEDLSQAHLRLARTSLSIWTGANVWRNTTGCTRSSSWIRPTGVPRDTVATSVWNSTITWPRRYGLCRVRPLSQSTTSPRCAKLLPGSG